MLLESWARMCIFIVWTLLANDKEQNSNLYEILTANCVVCGYKGDVKVGLD